MQLFYEGTNITRDVDVVKCVHRDASGGRCDSMEIEFENAQAWYRWKPRCDDRIEARMDGYSTGVLFLNTILPMEGRYRIIATSLPGAARRKAFDSFVNSTLEMIVHRLSAEFGFEARLYGISADLTYPFLLRRNEGSAAFLDRICRWDGALVKAFNGALRVISVSYAQELHTGRVLRIMADQKGAVYTKRENTRLSGVTVSTPYARATVYDEGAIGNLHPVITGLPARDDAQAMRFARGILLMHNREAERLSISASFDAGMTAMIRVDVEGNTDANGQWLVDEVEHDLFNGRSTARLFRVLNI